MAKYRLREQFNRVFFPILIITTILYIFLITIAAKSLINNWIQQNFIMAENNIKYSLDNLFGTLDDIYLQLVLGESFESVINDNISNDTNNDNILKRKELDGILLKSTISKSYILSAAIINREGIPVVKRNMLYTDIFSISSTYYEGLHNKTNMVDLSIINIKMKNNSNKSTPFLLLTRKITHMGYYDVFGYLTILMDFKEIEKIFENNRLTPSQSYYVFDQNNKLLYPETVSPEIKNALLKPDKQLNIFRYNMPNSNLILISYIPPSYLDDTIRSIQFCLTLFFIIFTLMTVIIVYFTLKRATRPLEALTRKMDNYRVSDPYNNEAVSIPATGISEVDTIGESFEAISKRIKSLIEDINKKNEQTLINEIQILQAQINPHFMSHTLNTIFLIARINKNDSICNIVNSLTELLQVSINNKDTLITVEEELRYIRNYLEIENYRFDTPVSLTIDVAENLLNYRITKLILQPIVENCITHGFVRNQFKKDIHIECKVQDSDIIFKVIDNGCGINERELQELMEGRKKAGGFSGIGLKNVNDRLRLRFGEKYEINIASTEGSGTTVKIRHPIILE